MGMKESNYEEAFITINVIEIIWKIAEHFYS